MKKSTEIVRVVPVTLPDAIDDRVVQVHIHIHLSEDEARRLLLPHVAEAFAGELWQRSVRVTPTYTDSTTSAGACSI
ncbi:MAG TPA: hypothetical protein VNF46_06525 [Gammaproteobacteria bacterium]|nr:hypothetical protein [Gammaproteobacteria bacterium]